MLAAPGARCVVAFLLRQLRQRAPGAAPRMGAQAAGRGRLLQRAARLAPQLALDHGRAGGGGDGRVVGQRLRRVSRRGSQSAPMPRHGLRSAPARRASRSSASSSAMRSQNGRSQARASSCGAERGSARGRARGHDGVAPVGRVELHARRGAAGRHRARRRAPRRPACAAGSRAAVGEKAWCLASSRAVCSAGSGCCVRRCASSCRRSACVRRATPAGSSPSSSMRARAHRGRRAPIRRPAGVRPRPPAAPAGPCAAAACSWRIVSSRRGRSCRRCRLAAASRWPSTRNSASPLQRVGVVLDHQRALRGAVGAAVAGGEVLGQRFAQPGLRCALARATAPFARALRQADQAADGARRQPSARRRPAARA